MLDLGQAGPICPTAAASDDMPLIRVGLEFLPPSSQFRASSRLRNFRILKVEVTASM
ncbi:hypothetical protein G5V57_15040 [Nordella sp. HKS 07]|uniref:hypothetical protein n=1 Tax=Nordella sp. HKS 07 TaxID=2712222 RepID=UPI0013E125EA|nr:hypothetical protein [Nordella sp. HKS 07]QIG48925.1 hypothetical protein G5V57_15040 [Nordella sp. HKS 07]